MDIFRPVRDINATEEGQTRQRRQEYIAQVILDVLLLYFVIARQEGQLPLVVGLGNAARQVYSRI